MQTLPISPSPRLQTAHVHTRVRIYGGGLFKLHEISRKCTNMFLIDKLFNIREVVKVFKSIDFEVGQFNKGTPRFILSLIKILFVKFGHK